MKHALLVEVPEWDATAGLRPSASATTMAGLLDELGGWSIVECTGSAATREGILLALDRLLGTCGPNDTCLFHFFGHGGMAQFPALGGDLGNRPVFYLATLRPPGAPVVGVLDFEISAALTRLDAICGNVTAIIDCCHSGSMVRSGPTVEPPAWLSALADREGEPAHRVAAESHPRIVRLSGASSLRTAYARHGPAGPCGWVTLCFVELVREAKLRCDRLTWDTVAHRIRERASAERRTEEQRVVVLAGPRQRLVFSTRAARLPRSAAYLPSPADEGGRGRGWLRAGALQGVRVGDRWSLAALTLDDALAPRFVADLRIERVELDLAEVSVVGDGGAAVETSVGATALLRELEQRMPVAVEGAATVAAAIDASGWVCVAARDSTRVPRVVCERASEDARSTALVLLELDGRAAWRSAAATDPTGELLDLLEDRARAACLLAALESLGPTAAHDVPLRLRWGFIDADERPASAPAPTGPRARPRLHAGDRLWLELVHEGATPPHWFASVIALGPDGRPRLLNAREPEGLELAPGATVRIGLRGRRGHEGLPLVWPAGVPQDAPRPMTLVVLASHRPLPLGHLVGTPDPDDDAAFVTEGLPLPLRGRSRGIAAPTAAPVASRGWASFALALELDPQPRPITLRSSA